MHLSKNQKRKLDRYGVIPAHLRTISEQGSSVFRQSFGDDIKTAKKRIYRKPYYRYEDVFDTASPQFLRIDLLTLDRMLSEGKTKKECAEVFDVSRTTINKATKRLKA